MYETASTSTDSKSAIKSYNESTPSTKREASKTGRFSVEKTTRHETNLRQFETNHFKTVGCVPILQRTPSELSKIKCNILPEKEVDFLVFDSVHLHPVSVGNDTVTFWDWDGDFYDDSAKPSCTFFKENQIADLFHGCTEEKSDYRKACEERIIALLTYGINIFDGCTTPTCMETALFYIAHGIVVKDNKGGNFTDLLTYNLKEANIKKIKFDRDSFDIKNLEWGDVIMIFGDDRHHFMFYIGNELAINKFGQMNSGQLFIGSVPEIIKKCDHEDYTVAVIRGENFTLSIESPQTQIEAPALMD
ncbi:hypothetical protein [Endozoicomonas sp.]|uniref:hypothetical protein n=1 Tax=Endozoicomonas sp. TaxID=1892382 RepID=UPI00383B4193